MLWHRPKGDPNSTDFWVKAGEERAVAEYETEHNLQLEGASAPKPKSAYHIVYAPSLSGSAGWFEVYKGSSKINSFYVSDSSDIRLMHAIGDKAQAFLNEVEKYEAL